VGRRRRRDAGGGSRGGSRGLLTPSHPLPRAEISRSEGRSGRLGEPLPQIAAAFHVNSAVPIKAVER